MTSSINSYADDLFSCLPDHSASILWEAAKGTKDKPVFSTRVGKDEPDSKYKVLFAFGKKGGTIKGNADQVELKKVGDDYYLETTPAGNVVFYRLFRQTQRNPTYVVSMKAYDFSGPSMFTQMYKCD